MIVAVPTAELHDDVVALLDPSLGIEVVIWDGESTPPATADIVVPPYMKQGRALDALSAINPRLVQGQAIGFDGVEERLPAGSVYANATSVHETAAAELAVGLLLVAQRNLDGFVRDQDRSTWNSVLTPGLADRRIVMLGYGGVAKALAARLVPFEVDLVPVASRARVEDGIEVHAMDELASLLPTAEILVNVLPGGPETAGLIGDEVLSALPDGALVVNIGRGPTVDTAALVDHVRRGRIRTASDVFDPEPLPSDHELWTLPGAYITPHVGGRSGAMRPRIAKLVAGQAERLARGEEPINVVIRT